MWPSSDTEQNPARESREVERKQGVAFATLREMKALKEENQATLDEFCKNEFWKSYYESAPVGVKEFIEDGFRKDDSISRGERKRLADEREAKMSDEDIKFLAERGWHQMMRKHYKEVLEKRQTAK